MMNPKKASPLRHPLMAALDAEYARASKAKDLDRMAEVSAAVEALKRLWAEETPPIAVVTPTTRHQPGIGAATQPPAATKEEEAPIDLPLPATPGSARRMTMRDILQVAGPSLPEEAESRRAAAKSRLKDAVLRVSALDDQIRYELAMQARNQNVAVMEMFREEAASLGLTVAALAQRIIDERHVQERRVMHAHAVLARVSAEIDQASGDAIDAAANAGIAEIERT